MEEEEEHKYVWSTLLISIASPNLHKVILFMAILNGYHVGDITPTPGNAGKSNPYEHIISLWPLLQRWEHV